MEKYIPSCSNNILLYYVFYLHTARLKLKWRDHNRQWAINALGITAKQKSNNIKNEAKFIIFSDVIMEKEKQQNEKTTITIDDLIKYSDINYLRECAKSLSKINDR